MQKCILCTMFQDFVFIFKDDIVSSLQDKVLCAVETNHRGFCALVSTEQTTYSLLPQGRRVALLLLHMPGTVSCFTDTWLTCLAAYSKTPLSVAPWNKHMHTMSATGCGWNRTTPIPVTGGLRAQLLNLILCLRCFKWRHFRPKGEQILCVTYTTI